MTEPRSHTLAGPEDCQDCHALVMFRVNDKGNRMILDREPNPEGNIVPRSNGTVHVLTKAEKERLPPGVTRYTDHHVTCPDREKWKRRKK